MSAVIEELSICENRRFLRPSDIDDLKNCYFQYFYKNDGAKLLQVVKYVLELARRLLDFNLPGKELVIFIRVLIRCHPVLPKIKDRIRDGQSCSLSYEKVIILFAEGIAELLNCRCELSKLGKIDKY